VGVKTQQLLLKFPVEGLGLSLMSCPLPICRSISMLSLKRERAACTECCHAVRPMPESMGVGAAPWGIGLEGLEEDQPVTQGPPQPAAAAGMTASPAMGSMAVEAATEEVLRSDAKAAHAVEAAPADTGLPSEHDDLIARQPHDRSDSSNLTAQGSKRPHDGLSSTAGSSSASEAAGVDGSVVASSEAPGSSHTVAPAGNADGRGTIGQGPQAPLRHYWGQVS